MTAPCSKPLGACCRPPPRPGLFLLPSRLPCIAHPSPSPTHTGLCVVPTRALHRQLPELCSPSPTCPRASQDGLRENSGNRRSPDSVAAGCDSAPGHLHLGTEADKAASAWNFSSLLAREARTWRLGAERHLPSHLTDRASPVATRRFGGAGTYCSLPRCLPHPHPIPARDILALSPESPRLRLAVVPAAGVSLSRPPALVSAWGAQTCSRPNWAGPLALARAGCHCSCL